MKFSMQHFLKYFMKCFVLFTIMALTQYASAQMQAPTPPTYEACPELSVQQKDNFGQLVFNNNTPPEPVMILVPDEPCLSRNTIKQRDYNAAVGAHNRGTRIITSDSGSMSAPPAPDYETCESTDATTGIATTNWACESRNQAKRRDYSIQMSAYNEAQRQQQIEARAATLEAHREQERQAELARLASAMAAMEEAEKKNEKSQKKYKLASQILAITSAALAVKFAMTCASCVGGCCAYNYLYGSIAAAIFSGMANKQAKSNADTAHQSCLRAAQISSTGGTCEAPPPFDPIVGVGDIFDPNGNCVGSPAVCAEIIANLPPGTNIKDTLKGVSSFATSKNAPFKKNADGSVTTKSGKRYSSADFANEKAMIASGMSPKDAKSLMASLNKSAADAGSAAKDALAASGSAGSGDYAGGGGGAGGSLTQSGEILLNGNARGGKDLLGADGKREIASVEGLAKDFHGEQIGVAGDDIFKMMNRRYKLKASQDHFIAP